MLKQCDARFLPQAMTKQERRVDGDGQHGSSYRLSDIVLLDEFAGTGLKVHLEASVAGLHHDVVMCNLELVQSLDVNRERSATQSNYPAVQLMIASNRGEIRKRKVRLCKRGKNA